MKFVISNVLFKKYPEVTIGVVVAKNLDNRGESKDVDQLLRREESKIRKQFVLDTLPQTPSIQNWRNAYKSFGSEERCSSEALIRTILKGNQIRHINKLVDLYNYVSLKYVTPVGGEDLGKIDGNIYLKFADGSDRFAILGGAESPREGEIVYADGKEVLCRNWNWRESENTKLTEDTRNAILVIDALPPVTGEVVKAAMDNLSDLVSRFCGASTATFMLNAGNREIDF